MLKKKFLKKIGITLFCLLVIEIIAIFPKKDDEYIRVANNNTGVIYLLDSNNFVSQLDIIYESKEQNSLIQEIIKLLTINKTENRIRQGFKAIIPENTQILDFQVKDKIVYLNFSKDLLSVPEELEEKMVEAIVFSLTSLKGISGVKIAVEENPLLILPHSHKRMPEILDRTIGINKSYDLTSPMNIDATTIYYLAKDHDYLYYVPVTKYSNEDKEKIEIIVEELKSSTTYNTNLISYINDEAKLINYEIFDKSLILNFNDAIFADINSKNIIEEVAYTINMSIQENYNVETVMYTVNDDIIDSYFLLRG